MSGYRSWPRPPSRSPGARWRGVALVAARVLTEKEVAVIVAACLNPKLPSILARQFVRHNDLDVPVEALARLLGDDIALATATAAMLTDPESLTEATLADVPTRLPWIFPVVQVASPSCLGSDADHDVREAIARNTVTPPAVVRAGP